MSNDKVSGKIAAWYACTFISVERQLTPKEISEIVSEYDVYVIRSSSYYAYVVMPIDPLKTAGYEKFIRDYCTKEKKGTKK